MLYYRIFKPQKFIRYAIIFGITFSFPIYLLHMTACAIICTPKVGHPWTLAASTKCPRAAVYVVVVGITTVILDIFLLILPILVILPLQLSVKRKIGILAVFMAGLL